MDPPKQCATLESSALRNVVYPGDEIYERRIDSHFPVSAQLRPCCLVQPTTAEEIALAATTLVHDTTCRRGFACDNVVNFKVVLASG